MRNQKSSKRTHTPALGKNQDVFEKANKSLSGQQNKLPRERRLRIFHLGILDAFSLAFQLMTREQREKWFAIWNAEFSMKGGVQ